MLPTVRSIIPGEAAVTQYLAGYAGRVMLGLGFALVLAGVGVVLARMGVLLFGVTSWAGWLSVLVAGIGIGAGLGSSVAWLWLKGVGPTFTLFLFIVALGAGILGGWLAFLYGSGVEPECCASPRLGPIAYSVLGAVIFANTAALLFGVSGQGTLRALRRRQTPSPLVTVLGYGIESSSPDNPVSAREDL